MGGPRPLGVARVLVVDADAHVRRSLGRALGLVADVTVAASGADALAALRTGTAFNLVLCDAASGVEVWRAARALSPEVAERFVFLTAHPEQLEGTLADAPCLLKPLDQDQIDALVAGLMRVVLPED